MANWYNDSENLYAKYQTMKHERTLTMPELVKRALLLYGIARSSVIAAIFMLLTHESAFRGAELAGRAYSPLQVILVFIEFTCWLFIPATVVGLFRLKNKTVTEMGPSITPESDYLWDYEGWK